MNRYLIDTNIMCFIDHDPDSLTKEVKEILADYENLIYISFESVKELIMLRQSGKIESKTWKTAKDIIDYIVNETNIGIKCMSAEHLRTLAGLPYFEDHKDPADRMIAAHAMTENITLISSDKKFRNYVKSGLKFVFNKR